MAVWSGLVVGPVRLLKLNRTKKWSLSEKSWSSRTENWSAFVTTLDEVA